MLPTLIYFSLWLTCLSLIIVLDSLQCDETYDDVSTRLKAWILFIAKAKTSRVPRIVPIQANVSALLLIHF
jgi:hypothetical protein